MDTKYRLAKNNKKDIDSLYDTSIEFENYNLDNSTRANEHFAGNWQKYFREEIVQSLTENNSWVWIAQSGEHVAGFIYARVCEGCYKFAIEELYVKDAFRKLGIGQKLLSLAIKQGKKFDYPIVAEVFDWNKSALEFYKDNNFGIDSILLKFSK